MSRTIPIFIVIMLVSVLPAACEDQRILLSHNIPEKVEAGSTVIFQFQFTDEKGVPVELDSVSVELTDPFGFKKQISLDKAGTGKYMFTWVFTVEGAYYLTVRGNKYGYISYSSIFLIDCVKSKAYLGWLFAFLNSPAVFVFVITPVSAFLLYRRVKGRKKK